jgi:hypothetical protein
VLSGSRGVAVPLHPGEQRDTVHRRGCRAGELPVERSYIDDDALRIEPAGEAVETDLAGRLLVGHAIVEMYPRLRADVFEIASQVAYCRFVGYSRA